MNRGIPIGRLSAETGCKIETIRYYEGIGLLPQPDRTGGNQRRYDAKHLDSLRFILHARQLGLPIDSVREVLKLRASPDAPCARAHDIARQQLGAVEEKIKQLQALARELRQLAESGSDQKIADCRVMAALNSHEHCDHGGTSRRRGQRAAQTFVPSR